MKLKYYLRGLGIGILVTAVIMTIANSNKTTMTDEEVKARAKELGMVESTILANISGQKTETTEPEETESTETSTEESMEESMEMSTEMSTEESTEETGETESLESTEPEESEPVETEPVETESEPAETEPVESEPVNEGETVSIVIRSGQSSVSVSKMLAEAGLVESATTYDRYLCDNGYDKRIRTGTHVIPVGAGDEEIARIITGSPQD